MDGWTLLQLADDADERTIKRTYARLLKGCRPDDDPEGFQRLREAYEHCLNEARWRADHEDDSPAAAMPVTEAISAASTTRLSGCRCDRLNLHPSTRPRQTRRWHWSRA